MQLFDSLSAKEKEKIVFIHFNHTNPLLIETSNETKLVKSKGFRIAGINLRIAL
jgi:pyrroloquinoline quinone biosynthesis protein B